MNWVAWPFLLAGKIESLGREFDLHDTYQNSFSYALTRNREKTFINALKDLAPDSKIIIGGHRALDFLERDWVDHVFLGYSETQITDWLKNHSHKSYPKIINWDIAANREWSFPDQGIVEWQDDDFIFSGEILPIEVGRGCIFNCRFCSYPLRGKKKLTYVKKSELLYHELYNNYEKYNVMNYVIVDNTFNDSTDKLKRFKKVVEQLPFQPQFWCYARLELLHDQPEQLSLLTDIGVREVLWGIESMNLETARSIGGGKGLSPEKKKEIVKTAKEFWGDKVRIRVSLIMGLPFETRESIRRELPWFLSDDCPVEYVNMKPFILYRRDKNERYRPVSEFQENYEKWGYSFDESDHPFNWKRNDGGGIDSFQTAVTLANHWNDLLEERNKPHELFYFGNDLWLEKQLDKLLIMDKNRFNQLLVEKNHCKDQLFKQIKKLYVNLL